MIIIFTLQYGLPATKYHFYLILLVIILFLFEYMFLQECDDWWALPVIVCVMCDAQEIHCNVCTVSVCVCMCSLVVCGSANDLREMSSWDGKGAASRCKLIHQLQGTVTTCSSNNK